jgi:hypothetical protein
MAETVPMYPGLYAQLSRDDSCSFATDSTLLTLQTRVPNEVLAEVDWVGDLFKEMFERFDNGS